MVRTSFGPEASLGAAQDAIRFCIMAGCFAYHACPYFVECGFEADSAIVLEFEWCSFVFV